MIKYNDKLNKKVHIFFYTNLIEQFCLFRKIMLKFFQDWIECGVQVVGYPLQNPFLVL